MVTTAQSTPTASPYSPFAVIPPILPVAPPVSAIVSLYDLIHQCIDNGEPMVVLYNTGGEDLKPRVLWPSRLLTSQQGEDWLRAHDSLRDTTRSFRVSRILSAHLLQA